MYGHLLIINWRRFIPQRNVFDEEEQADLFNPDIPEIPEEKIGGPDNVNVDDRLEELAREISSARIKESDGDAKKSEPEFGEIGNTSTIVSETLAKIYAAQGEYQEAINVYEKLIDKTPSRKEEYLASISELKSKLNPWYFFIYYLTG